MNNTRAQTKLGKIRDKCKELIARVDLPGLRKLKARILNCAENTNSMYCKAQLYAIHKEIDEFIAKKKTDLVDRFNALSMEIVQLEDSDPPPLPAGLIEQGKWVENVYKFLYVFENLKKLRTLLNSIDMEEFKKIDDDQMYLGMQKFIDEIKASIQTEKDIQGDFFLVLLYDRPVHTFYLPKIKNDLEMELLLSRDGFFFYSLSDCGNDLVSFTMISERPCNHCVQEIPKDGLRHKCGLCRMVRYCGKECQRRNWKSHRGLCRLFWPL